MAWTPSGEEQQENQAPPSRQRTRYDWRRTEDGQKTDRRQKTEFMLTVRTSRCVNQLTDGCLALAYLRVSLEVSLENRLVDPLARDWARGVASCDRLGEAGGPL